MEFTAHDWVAVHAEHRPDSIALANGDTGVRYTWGELDQRVGRAANLLRTTYGIKPGDRVALIADNDPRVFEMQFVCMRLGAIFVPINWRLTPHELADICLDCEPSLLVHDGVWAEVSTEVASKAQISRRLAWDAAGSGAGDYEAELAGVEWIGPNPDNNFDTLTHLIYTSGTTGKPKGALYSYRTLTFQILNVTHTTGVAGRDCHHLNPMPLFHAGGLHVMANPVLYYGGRVTTVARFDPAFVFQAMAGGLDEPVTHYAGIPLMYTAIAAQPGFAEADLSALRHPVIAGAIAPPELLRLWSDRGFPLEPQYGGTEMGPMALALDRWRLDKAEAGSAGQGAFHTEIRLVADGKDVPVGTVGEIWLRGPSVTIGYWGKDNKDFFEPDGWFRTGDAARRDEEGFYYLAGRTKEMYKSGGENVYPAEVENVLAFHPAVVDLAVIGIPDPRWDEVGCVVMVLKPGESVTLEELNEFGREKLAKFKLPKKLVIVDELPRNVTGKVNRLAMRELYG